MGRGKLNRHIRFNRFNVQKTTPLAPPPTSFCPPRPASDANLNCEGKFRCFTFAVGFGCTLGRFSPVSRALPFELFGPNKTQMISSGRTPWSQRATRKGFLMTFFLLPKYSSTIKAAVAAAKRNYYYTVRSVIGEDERK